MHDYKLTYIRTIALFSIIAFHCLCYYSPTVSWPFHGSESAIDNFLGNILVSFALPFFVLISGSLAGMSNVDAPAFSDIQRKFKRLIVPYFSWTLIQIPLFYGYISLRIIVSGSFHLWFLLMLFWCYLIFYIFRPQFYGFIDNHSCCVYLIVFILLFISRFITRYTTSVLCLNQFVTYFPYFLLGIIVRRRDELCKNTVYFRYLLPISVIFYLMGCFGAMYLERGGSVVSFFRDISLVVAFISTYSLLPNNESNILIWIEKNSMGVYIIHHIVIWLLLMSSFGRIISDAFYIGPICLFVICTPTAFLLSVVISRVKIIKSCLL